MPVYREDGVNTWNGRVLQKEEALYKKLHKNETHYEWRFNAIVAREQDIFVLFSKWKRWDFIISGHKVWDQHALQKADPEMFLFGVNGIFVQNSAVWTVIDGFAKQEAY